MNIHTSVREETIWSLEMETAALASGGGDEKTDNREIEVVVGSATEICLALFLQDEEEEEGMVSFAVTEDFIAISAIAIGFSATLSSSSQINVTEKKKRQRLYVVCKLFLQLRKIINTFKKKTMESELMVMSVS